VAVAVQIFLEVDEAVMIAVQAREHLFTMEKFILAEAAILVEVLSPEFIL
jgi:hypothetical protein